MKTALPALLAMFSWSLAHAQAPINIIFNTQHATCGNTTGSILASVWGGTAPYTLVWSPAPPTGQGTSNITAVQPGTYTLTVTDANANEASAAATVLLTMDLFPAIVDPVAWACEPGCTGNYYNWFPLNGAGMPITVTFDPPGPGGGASPNGLYFNGLCVGETYDVTVTDNSGCAGFITGLTVEGPLTPTIANQSITPSCPEGATGGFVIEFSEADSIMVNSGQITGTLIGNMFTASNLAPGSYTIWVSAGNGSPNPPGGTSGPWCSASFTIEVPETTEPCGTLSGRMYADLNADCDENAEDAGMPFRVITIEPGGHHTLTDALGNIAAQLLYGAYDLDANPAGYTAVCPSLPAPFALDAGSPAAAVSIAMEPAFGPDASAYLVAGVHRPGFQVQYTVSARNQGPYTFDGATLNLYFDPVLVLSENGGGLLMAPGHLQWVLGALAPYSWSTFVVTFTVPANASLIGTQVSCIAELGLAEPDSDPGNDSYSLTSTIVGAYDPNDKLASTSSRNSEVFYYLDADQWVDYTIRFQNTGSAEAINVHLTDTISPQLDLASLQLLGASHAFTAQLLPGRVLRFDFPGIMLPDSTSDQLGSQGFASFRLRPVDGLVIGNLLENNADIFFDFNEPVRTNTATLIVEFSTGLSSRSPVGIMLSPNPAHDFIRMTAPAGTSRLEVICADGRLAMEMPVRDASIRIDLAKLPTGMYSVRCLGAGGQLGHGRFVRQ